MFRRVFYLRSTVDGRTAFIHAWIQPGRTAVSEKTAPHMLAEWPAFEDPSVRLGRSLAVLAWPGKHPSGDLVLNDTYLPETVFNVRELRQRAELYHCRKGLDDALDVLRKRLTPSLAVRKFPLVVVLLARRPAPLMDGASEVEICPYVVNVGPGNLLADGESAVHVAAHRHQITRSLLAQMAGEDRLRDPPAWTLLGAGSLGSKIAVHLARAGRGPRIVVDRSSLSPHNAARHALLPQVGEGQCLWARNKAIALCEGLRGLRQKATPVAQDAVSMAAQVKAGKRVLGRDQWAVVDTTASLPVQEALAGRDGRARVITTYLLGGGKVGVVTVEGPNGNPSATDLAAECYRLLATDTPGAGRVLQEGGSSWQPVGQGCGSLTMAMSDGRLSLFAAAMAEHLLQLQRQGLPDQRGAVLIGMLSDQSTSMNWTSTEVRPTEVVQTENGGWQIRVGGHARRCIEEDVRRWPAVETGGVLIGRVSEVNKRVLVVDVLPAPEDSRRATSQFVLGKQGLRPKIDTYAQSVSGALYCVGTWHNHLAASGPSDTDRRTERELPFADQTPAVLLIHTPKGYCGLLADVSPPKAEGYVDS